MVEWWYGYTGVQRFTLICVGRGIAICCMIVVNALGNDTNTLDREGWRSTRLVRVKVVIGYVAGVFMQQWGKELSKPTKRMLAGAVWPAIAYAWYLLFPIHKNFGQVCLCCLLLGSI